MTTWNDVLAAAPDLAKAAQARFEATGLGMLATLRADGSPRISGIEPSFWRGELWFGSMWEARKALDLRRDPRFALHAATADKDMKGGDAKVAGRAEEVTDAKTKAGFGKDFGEENGTDPNDMGPWHLFRAEVTEVVHVEVADDQLVVRSWHPGTGEKRIERR